LVLGSELDVGTDLFLDAPEPLAGVGGLATRVVGDLDGDGVSELVGDCLLWSDQWVHGDVQACEYQPVLSTDWGLFPVHHDDVDGDDRDDLVLVARGWPADSAEVAHNSLAFVAGASVGRGQPLELTEPDTVVLGNEPGVYFGWGAALGDADGDGLGDVAIESEDAYGAGPSTGWVVWGKDLAWGDTQAIEDAAVRLPWHGTRLWMTPAGDVNCDGYADLLAHDSDVRDGVWGFKGAVDADATWDLADPDFQLIHGFELLEPIRVGDQDGDGCDDLVVTRTGRDWGPRVITRVPSTGTYDVDAVATLTMWQGDTWHVASMGDLDGDGADDLYFRTDTHDRTASLLLSLPPDW
jgi:hypothetical protein